MSDSTQVKPTPTQDELDRHARGERISEHEHDGSPLEPSANPDHYGHTHAERVMIPEGMNFIPPSERAVIDEEETKKAEVRKEKSAEADRDTASYKTRSTQAEKTRKTDKERE